MPSWRSSPVPVPSPSRIPSNSFYNPGVLGGRGANRTTYTKAQVGAGVKPNPAPPGPSSWVGSHAVPDPRRTAYPDSDHSGQPAYRLPSAARSFRGRGWGAPPDVIVGGPGTQAPSGSVTRRGSHTLDAHAQGHGFPVSPQPVVEHLEAYPQTGKPFTGGSNAVPDKSRQWNPHGDPAGYPLAVSPAAYPREFMTENRAVTGVGGGGQVPAEWMRKWNIIPQRPRAGGTSDDDYRLARRWTQTPSARPFDKNGLSYPGTGRHTLPAPLASTPLFYPSAVKDAVPSPGGHTPAPGMRPVGVQRNTARLLPQAWDTTYVNAGTGTGGARVGQGYRARAWKAG